jgi:microsomal dipeptidase-like Zn-dependent dipeptidase
MEHRLELAAKALAIERVATGGLAAIAPARAIRTITTPKSDTEAARYVARLLGIRQVVLGVMLWQTRHDRAWLRRMATLNALMEALDAVATLEALVQRRGGDRPSAATVGAALSASAVFLALRAAAS